MDKLSKNGKERVKSIIILEKMCNGYLDYIASIGNECAYTDRMIENIKDFASKITEEI